jgi:protoporphyrinogen oxidase
MVLNLSPLQLDFASGIIMLMVILHSFNTPNRPILKTSVVIVGGGLAGLACAIRLEKAGIPYLLIEASNKLGGRVQTTHHAEGFLLDHGFQALNTAYEEAKAVLDFDALDLQPFYPGAVIRHNGTFNKVGDPQRDRGMYLFALYSPIGSLKDKLLTLSLKNKLKDLSEKKIYRLPEETTLAFLQRFGFSQGYIDAFFRPFYGGAFLEDALSTSVRKFAYTFKTFANGDVCIPKNGMHAIVDQLASNLNPTHIMLNQGLIHLSPPSSSPNSTQPRTLTLSSGQQIEAQHVVLAMSLPQVASVLGQPCPINYNATWTLYFSCKDKPPLSVREPLLVLNAEGSGVIQHLCFLTEVSPSYAPEEGNLCSVTLKPSLLNEPMSEAEAVLQTKANLKQWFGPVTDRWQFIQGFQLHQAIPSETVLFGDHQAATVETVSAWQQQWQVDLANDAMDSASINGALRAGRVVADRLIKASKL